MGMRKVPHTSCHRGKRVLVVLRNGERIVDRYVERTDRWVVLKKRGRVSKADVRAFIVLKEGE